MGTKRINYKNKRAYAVERNSRLLSQLSGRQEQAMYGRKNAKIFNVRC